MKSVAQAFHELITSLELTPRQREEAERQRQVVTGHLQRGFSVKEPFISGSFGRGTAIRPLNDIDLFLELNRTPEDLRSGDPDRCLKRIREVLHVAYRGNPAPRLQGRSVNIEFSGTGIGFDVVPAFEVTSHSGVYEIPDRNRRGWIQTNPRMHAQHAKAANERAGSKANPLVKLLKHWNCTQPGKRPVRSFHLELMVYDALQAPPASYSEGVARLFAELADRVMWPCYEPALRSDVAASFSPERRQKAQNKLREAAHVARQALDAERAAAQAPARRESHLAEAHGHWRRLFGDAYPERGR